jgi:hypothetical protein
MGLSSYGRYWFDQRARVPIAPENYLLQYTINGQLRHWS